MHHNFSQVSNLASMLEGVESTTEEFAQHKYSRLDQSSYDYFNSKGDADLVNKNLKNPKYSHVEDLKGFELDKELSTLDDAGYTTRRREKPSFRFAERHWTSKKQQRS